jgi:hypothetical protein
VATATAPQRALRPDDPQREAIERTTLDLATDLCDQFSARNGLYEEIEATLHQEYSPQIPEAYRATAVEVRSPLAMHIASTITAALSVNPVTIGFKPIGFGDVYQQNSTRRERFFESSWKRQEEEARRQLLRLFLWSLAVKGEGILKTQERTSAVWAEYSSRAKELQEELDAEDSYDQDVADRLYDHGTEQIKLTLPYPICTTDVPPETFYYTKNENGMTCAMEIKELPYHEALERFGAGLDRDGRVIPPETWGSLDPQTHELARAEWNRAMGRQRTIRCIEAWDYQTQVVLLSGPGQRTSSQRGLGSATVVRLRRHGYGDAVLKTLRGPYFHALGITTASRLPEHAGLGVLYGYLPLFRLLDSLLTMRANAAYLTGFPAFKHTQPPGAVPGLPNTPYGLDGREHGHDKIEPGKLYPYDIAPIDQPRSGADFDKLLENVRLMLETALPSVVQGLVASDQSGYALNQAAYLARLSWDPIVANAEVALGERTGFESWLIEHRIGEAVYAWGEQEQRRGAKRGGGQVRGTWLSIGPEDLNGVHRYTATLKPSTPSNEIIETRALGEKMTLKLITYEDAVEESGGNPDEVEKSWLLHDLKQSPEIQQELKQAVFQKVATLRAARMQAAGMPSLQELAGGGGPPGPGGPPTGGPALPGGPPTGGPGGMPPNPVPTPGQGLPLIPPPPAGLGGAVPPGGVPSAPRGGGAAGTPVVPNPPPGMVPLPG